MTISILCRCFLALLLVPLFALRAVAQPRAMAIVSPEVHADRSVTFRILAPNAKVVIVQGGFSLKPIPLAIHHQWHETPGPGHGGALWRQNLRDRAPKLFIH
jgi:hypothetical protein